jgi:hypothetical protein
MNRQSDHITQAFKEHLEILRRGCRDAAEHITISQEAIKRSFELLVLTDKLEAELRAVLKP